MVERTGKIVHPKANTSETGINGAMAAVLSRFGWSDGRAAAYVSQGYDHDPVVTWNTLVFSASRLKLTADVIMGTRVGQLVNRLSMKHLLLAIHDRQQSKLRTDTAHDRCTSIALLCASVLRDEVPDERLERLSREIARKVMRALYAADEEGEKHEGLGR
jgi:hypothetical protein